MELPGLNHLLQTAPTGALSEYATIEETMAPAALQTIGDWIDRVILEAKPKDLPIRSGSFVVSATQDDTRPA